jgi:hypothetical protein
MLAPTPIQVLDIASWHRLTDEYAAALNALQRGEPMAREQVRSLCVQLRRTLRLHRTGDTMAE